MAKEMPKELIGKDPYRKLVIALVQKQVQSESESIIGKLESFFSGEQRKKVRQLRSALSTILCASLASRPYTELRGGTETTAERKKELRELIGSTASLQSLVGKLSTKNDSTAERIDFYLKSVQILEKLHK